MKNILNALAAMNFFQVEVVADLTVDGVIYHNIPQRNNDSIISPKNWHKKKNVFFQQRMDQYSKYYYIDEKIRLELERVRAVPTDALKYKILKRRYISYLIYKNSPKRKAKRKTHGKEKENQKVRP